MTIKREQPIAIPNADDACSLDLSIPCPNGEDIIVPFGLVETQTLDNPKSDEQRTSTIAITPKIFNDAGLDKRHAAAPDFIEKIDTLPKNAACGYLYIFIDGYLWREIACTGLGMLSDVDLMQQHSKDHRPHVTKAARQIILPTQTRSLYNGNTLTPVVAEIAFSRTQWAWQYINDLGGMFETDKRFALSALKSKCLDKGRAEQLRGARCQKFDFTQQPNPADCKFIEKKGKDYIVYLHDMFGIAHRLHIILEEINGVLEQEYQRAKAQPYYDSAILAHQLYFNDKLHEKRMEWRTNYAVETYSDNSSEASSLRKVANKLDQEEIEKMLISKEAISLLEQYLDIKETLIDFLTGYAGEYTLDELCEQNGLPMYTEWPIAMQDLSTLPIVNYHSGIAAVYGVLNSANKPMRQVPIFTQAIVDKTERKRLTTRMAEVEAKANAFTKELSDNERSWLRVQFCANINAFGEDMKNTTPEKVDNSEELGIFDPEKLAKSIEEAEKNQDILGELFTLGMKAAKSSSALTLGMIDYWKKNANLSEHVNAKELSFQVVGTTLKSTGLDPFKDIQFAKFGAIPDDYAVVGGTIQSHSLFKHLKDSDKRRADLALQRVVKAIKQNGKPERRDIAVLEKYASKGTHTSRSERRNTIVVDRKSGATVATTTRAGVAELIQKAIDGEFSIDELRRLEFKVFVIPQKDIPQSIAFKYEESNPLKGTQGIKLEGMARVAKRMHHAAPGAIFMLDSMLTAFAYENYEDNFGKKGRFYEIGKNAVTFVEWLVSGATAFDAYITNQTIMSKPIVVENVESFKDKAKAFLIGDRIVTRLTIAAGAIGALGSIVVAWDAYILLGKKDIDAAAMGFASAGMGFAAAIAGGLGFGGPVVWAFIIGSCCQAT